MKHIARLILLAAAAIALALLLGWIFGSPVPTPDRF